MMLMSSRSKICQLLPFEIRPDFSYKCLSRCYTLLQRTVKKVNKPAGEGAVAAFPKPQKASSSSLAKRKSKDLSVFTDDNALGSEVPSGLTPGMFMPETPRQQLHTQLLLSLMNNSTKNSNTANNGDSMFKFNIVTPSNKLLDIPDSTKNMPLPLDSKGGLSLSGPGIKAEGGSSLLSGFTPKNGGATPTNAELVSGASVSTVQADLFTKCWLLVVVQIC